MLEMQAGRFKAVGIPGSLVRSVTDLIAAQLAAADLPSFPGVCLATDFGGEHRGADYHTYAFLVCPSGSLAPWDAARLVVRRPELGSSVMGYKHLGDGRRARALGPFLEAADCIPGFLAVVAVGKSVQAVGSDEIKQHPPVKAWKPKSREKLGRVLPLAVGLVGGVLEWDANVAWVTDRDEITEGGRLQTSGDALAAGILGSIPEWTGQVTVATTGADGEDLLLEDLTAIPDLVAGAMGDVLNPGSIAAPEDVRQKTIRIIRWMGQSGSPLIRLGYTLDRIDDGSLVLTQLAWGVMERAVPT